MQGDIVDLATDESPEESPEDAPKDAPEDSDDARSVSSESSAKSEDKKEEKVVVGMVCDRKNLYQKWDRHNRFTWSDDVPGDLEEAAENAQTIKYAILVRNKKSYDSRKRLEVDSIVIQSPRLKEVLHDVLKDYPGVTTKLSRLTFAAPFKPFVHRWAQFTEALESDKYDETTKSHAKLLYDVLLEELADVIAALKDYAENQVITYEHVWTIFQPGSILYASRYGRPIALRLDQGNYMEHNRYGHCFLLKVDRVDWDGSKFGFDTTHQPVLPFAGTVSITDLDCYPLEFHPESEVLREQLLERGRAFEKLAGCHFKYYKGRAVDLDALIPTQVSVDSRIVIDAFAFHKFGPTNGQQTLKSLQRAENLPDVQNRYDDGNGGDYYEDNYDTYPSHEDIDDSLDGNGERTVLPLTEEQLLLCTPIVKGYALKTKKWFDFLVDLIDEVTFDETAFEGLVLPAGHKSMILAFAQSQVQHKDKFDDDISGKGKGMVMMLSGGPGIGKTLTAEAVAEAMRVPLYVMSAGDLGVSSADVEDNLNRVLEMAAKWNAVLLLDECDVFLEARNTTDLDRNRIVSIFLRTLEYYQGILFLTTNRVKNMDDAFHSRIHISLEYPPLDRPARKKVWQGALHRSAAAAEAAAEAFDNALASSSGAVEEQAVLGHEVTNAQVEKLAKLEVNGRVIKNVLKTGSLLACHQGKKLSYEHLKTVLKVEGYSVEN